MAYSNKGPQGDGGNQPKTISYQGGPMGGQPSSGLPAAAPKSVKKKDKPKSGWEKFTNSLSGPQTEKQKAASAAFHESMNKSEGDADQMAQDAMNQGIGSLGGAKSDTDMYADNLKRYNDYMESQKQPPPTEITPDMRNAALSMFESQQGAGQMPYYMAAGLDPQATNMSPAFQYAAQNYDTLGGSQRLAPRPMEMMSVAERNRINDMSQAMANSQPQPTPYAPNYMPQPNINFGPPPPPTPQMNEGQQYEMFKQLMSGQGGKGNAPTEAQPTQSDFGRMLAARFGGGNQGGGGFGF